MTETMTVITDLLRRTLDPRTMVAMAFVIVIIMTSAPEKYGKLKTF